jgi:hypothetical protein
MHIDMKSKKNAHKIRRGRSKSREDQRQGISFTTKTLDLF